MKALFRRSQALQKLGRLDQAVSDLQRCVSLEPKNKAFQEALRALGSSMHEKVRSGWCGGCCVPSGCSSFKGAARAELLFPICLR